MKKYICRVCNCTFRVHYYEEYPGSQQLCPNCRSTYVQRIKDDPVMNEPVTGKKEQFGNHNVSKGWRA
jgi:hypothetical protein